MRERRRRVKEEVTHTHGRLYCCCVRMCVGTGEHEGWNRERRRRRRNGRIAVNSLLGRNERTRIINPCITTCTVRAGKERERGK